MVFKSELILCAVILQQLMSLQSLLLILPNPQLTGEWFKRMNFGPYLSSL